MTTAELMLNFFKEPLFVGDDDGRAIRQGNDSELHVRDFRGVVRIGSAGPTPRQTGGQGTRSGGAVEEGTTGKFGALRGDRIVLHQRKWDVMAE